MEFTFDEKAAVFFSLEVLAVCDGQMTEEEKDLLFHLMSTDFGLTIEDALQGVYRKFNYDNSFIDAGNVIKQMDGTKREKLKSAMDKMLDIDPMNRDKSTYKIILYVTYGFEINSV